MAENGILDYQGMNQAIYRGATSNIVVDTQSMSIEIGAGNSSHTSNLHFECNHDANVASIQLNSNVVTEFSRSKKLIKYPRVALTGSTSGGYTASANAEESDGRAVWKLFDNTGNATAWRSEGNGDYNASGAYTGSANLGSDSGGTAFADADKGDWVKIQLPHKIKLDHFTLQVRNSPTFPGGSSISYGRSEFIKNGKVWGSNDGTSWSLVHTISGTSASNDTVINTYTVTSSIYYRYFGLVITDTNATVTGLGTSLSEIELYGIPEYDPEAYGTDVTIKSEANVPNTDWLEVYYDAKNYSGTGDVQDETTNNRGGVLYGNTTLSSADGIHKFDFDGNGDYIKTTLTGFTGTTVTFSAWVFMDSVDTTRANTIMGLGSWGSTGSASWIAVGTGGNLETGLKGIASCGSPVQATILTGRWLHITGIVSSGDFRFYQDGQLIKSLTTTGTINYGTNPVLYIATRADSSGNPEATRYFDCKIANARLFNRALTTDEIYQLYAYQKGYFGHGDLSMTLKAGRLGIGTSEPKAALDVQGIPHGPNSRPCWRLLGSGLNVDNLWSWSIVQLDNFGGASGSTYYTIPVSGYYFIQAVVIVSASGARATLNIRQNGVTVGADFIQDPVTTTIDTNRPWNQLMGMITHYFNKGDQVTVYTSGSTYGGHNCFTGFHLGF